MITLAWTVVFRWLMSAIAKQAFVKDRRRAYDHIDDLVGTWSASLIRTGHDQFGN